MKFALVTWTDAAHCDTYEPKAPVGLVCQAAGHLVHENLDGIVLALEKFDDGSYRTVLEIPRGMIREIKPLRLR